jgi:hypothetical protein
MGQPIPGAAWIVAILIALAAAGIWWAQRISQGQPRNRWTRALIMGLAMMIGSLLVTLLNLAFR